MKFALEEYRIFPIVAWGLVIAFVLFTYTLTTKLLEATDPLQENRDETVVKLEHGVYAE